MYAHARVHSRLLTLLLAVAASACREEAARPAASVHGPDDGHGHPASTHGPDDGHDHGTAAAHDPSAEPPPFAAAIPSEPVPEDQWCFEHEVPEAVCTRCKPDLIAGFKTRNDWCSGHDRPESQCLLCNPELKPKWAAVRPRIDEPAGRDVSAAAGMAVDRPAATNRNDPLCQVDQMRIRFVDPTIAEKSGLRVEEVRPRRMSVTLECPGEIEFDRNRVAHIAPRVKGIVAETHVDLGTAVGPGDVLAVIESPTLGEAKSDYIEMHENYLLAKSDFDRVSGIHRATQRLLEVCKAQATADEVREKLGDVRVGEARSRLLKAHAALQLARQSFERETRLREQQLSSEKSFETAKAGLSSAEAEFQATREAIAFENERSLRAAERALKVARSALDAAQRRLSVLGLTETHIEALAAGSVQILARHEIRSPIAGRVVELHAVMGESVNEETPLFTVADTSTMWAMLAVSERDLVKLRTGQRVLFTVDGLGGRSFEGQIDWISSQVDNRTRTVRARVTLPNGEGLLRARMFGTALIVLHDNEEVLTLPTAAVQTDGCCQLVFVREADDLYEPRKVVLGPAAGGFTEVLDGVATGEPVVTTGSFLLKTEVLKGNLGAGCCEVEPGR